MFRLVIVFGIAFFSSLLAFAHPEPRSCQQVYDLARELGCGGFTGVPSTTATPASDFVVNSNYGPTQCKTADALKVSLKELKEECNAWLKSQKAEMGTKYQSGVCNDDCQACGMGLKTCTVKGSVHYSK